MSSSNALFFFLMFMGPVISLSSSNWLIVWAGVEVAFLGLIPLLFSGNKYLSTTKEASLKYFCIQAFSSAILFLAGLIIFSGYGWLPEFFFILSICLKLGMFPGHFWVPSIVSMLDLVPCFLLLSWQKIPSLTLLILFSSSAEPYLLKFILFLGGLSALVGGVIGLNMNNFQSMIGASSISHTGWIVLGVIAGSMWMYFSLYCLVLWLLFVHMEYKHLYIPFCILSLSGLPPFIMFVAKWKIISSSMNCLVDMSFMILPVLGSILSLVFYLKFTYFYFMKFPKFNLMKSWLGYLSHLNWAGFLILVIAFFGDR